MVNTFDASKSMVGFPVLDRLINLYLSLHNAQNEGLYFEMFYAHQDQDKDILEKLSQNPEF